MQPGIGLRQRASKTDVLALKPKQFVAAHIGKIAIEPDEDVKPNPNNKNKLTTIIANSTNTIKYNSPNANRFCCSCRYQ